MKPIERIGRVPLDFVIYHELGHVFANKNFGRSCSIVFLPGPGAGAGTQSGWSPGAVEHDAIITDLAGAYSQSIYTADTVPLPIRRQILEGTLLDNGAILSGNIPEEAFFFHDDLQLIRRKLAARNLPSLEAQISICRTAFQNLRVIFSAPKRETFFARAHADILLWLEEDDPGLSIYDDCATYPSQRISVLFAAC